jgi:hypothetical protein
VACDLEVDVGRKVNRRLPPATAPGPFGGFSMSAYVVFAHILWRRRVIKGSIGVESLANHMRPDPGEPFMRLPPFNPAAVSVF